MTKNYATKYVNSLIAEAVMDICYWNDSYELINAFGVDATVELFRKKLEEALENDRH